jgi:hypothetical protein
VGTTSRSSNHNPRVGGSSPSSGIPATARFPSQRAAEPAHLAPTATDRRSGRDPVQILSNGEALTMADDRLVEISKRTGELERRAGHGDSPGPLIVAAAIGGLVGARLYWFVEHEGSIRASDLLSGAGFTVRRRDRCLGRRARCECRLMTYSGAAPALAAQATARTATERRTFPSFPTVRGLRLSRTSRSFPARRQP